MSNDQAAIANELEASLQSLLKVLTELSSVAKEIEATFRKISEQFDTEETGLTPDNPSPEVDYFKIRPRPDRLPNPFRDPEFDCIFCNNLDR